MRKSNKLAKVQRYLAAHPDASPKDVSAKLGVHLSFVYKARKQNPFTNVAAATAPVAIEPLLTDRGTRYGKFKDTAQVAQELKRVLTRHAHATGNTFTDSQWEALEMICHKTARIVNGDPNYVDSWRDIAGYAQLVADELEGIER